MSTKKPVIKEVYDEIVFNDPTDYFYRILKENQLTSAGTSPHPQSFARTAGNGVYIYVVVVVCA